MPMHYELYVDSLFFLNFIMNLYLLMLVDKTAYGMAKRGRLLAGAAAGAACFLLPFLMTAPAAVKFFLGVAAGTAGMLCIAFPVKSLRMFLKLLERLALYSFGLGGGILFLLRCMPGLRDYLTGVLGILGMGGLFYLLFGRFRCARDMEHSLCRAVLSLDGKRVEATALVDSGNSLTEPISGKPVSIVERKLFDSLWEKTPEGFRAIPYHSVGKKRGIMPGFLLPGLRLEIEGMTYIFNDVYIAVSEEEISGGAGPPCDAEVSDGAGAPCDVEVSSGAGVSGGAGAPCDAEVSGGVDAPYDAGAESVNMIINPGLFAKSVVGGRKKRQNERHNDSESDDTGQDSV